MSKSATSSSRSKPLPADWQSVEMGVTFFDLARMMEWSSSEDDDQIASFFQEFYHLAAAHIEPAGGRIVKYIGDAGLAVFPLEAGEKVILALCDLAAAVRRHAKDRGIDTHLNVNVHAGPVIAGTFGSPGAERFDVIGKTVNIAARLGRRGVVLSQQAFRLLSDAGRRRFDKAVPPVTYRFRG